MKRIVAHAGAAACCAFAYIYDASAAPNALIYTVTVRTSFGTIFTDCFRFGTGGNLTVGGYGNLNYTSWGLGPSNGWQAVAATDVAARAGFEIMFDGYRLGGANGRIKATGNNEFGDYFNITGVTGGICTPAAVANGSPYRARIAPTLH